MGIWVAILVAEPPEAAAAGVNISGAFHMYALAAHVNSAQVFASLRSADMPVELVSGIDYLRGMDDESGIGDLIVRVPAKESPFHSFNHSEPGYFATSLSLDAVFWYDGRKGKVALRDRAFAQPPVRRWQCRQAAVDQVRSVPATVFRI